MKKNVLSSDGALNLETLPKSIIIVGGGVIGMEWASMMHDFGVEVTVLEYADRILPTEDKEVAKELARLYKKKKLIMHTSAEVQAASYKKTDTGVEIKAIIKGEEQTFAADKILVSVGRSANTENIGLQNTDIATENGFIQVNDFIKQKKAISTRLVIAFQQSNLRTLRWKKERLQPTILPEKWLKNLTTT